MTRRKILQYVAYATGAAVSVPLASSFLVSCQSNATTTTNTATSNLYFFNNEQFAIIQELVDIILPKTDSPSATEVGVHDMIDSMVGTAYRPKDKATYQTKSTAFFDYLTKKGIMDMDGQGKMKALNELDKSSDEALKDAKQGYLNLKQQTIAYYLSSEAIGTQFLNYLPVPGAYEACISLEETGGKAWAI